MRKSFVGLNVGYHNSSACFLEITGGRLSPVVFEEERLTRIKNKGFFPYSSLLRLTRENDVSSLPPENFAVTNFGQSFEESLQGLSLKTIFPDFLRETKLDRCLLSDKKQVITHHESHLFSLLPLIREESALILIADACGSPVSVVRDRTMFPCPKLPDSGYENVSVYLKRGKDIECIRKLWTPHKFSAGVKNTLSDIYNQAAWLIFGGWEACGKVMGLGAFSERPLYSRDKLEDVLSTLEPNTQTGKAAFDKLGQERFHQYAQIAASVQKEFETEFGTLIAELGKRFPEIDALAFAGGSALNCLFNSRLLETGRFSRMIMTPVPNDEGVSLGAAVAAAYRAGVYKIGEQFLEPSPYLGSPLSLPATDELLSSFPGFQSGRATAKELAEIIHAGEVLACVRGRSECGPRALGHRSILASPFRKGMKARLNETVKFREAFRPYGISLLAEEAPVIFEVGENFDSPYMSFAPRVRTEFREKFAEVLQPDHSIRVQTVTSTDPEMENFLRELKTLTGSSAVIHTSLNVMGEPIVEGVADVKRFFDRAPVHHLWLNDLLLRRSSV